LRGSVNFGPSNVLTSTHDGFRLDRSDRTFAQGHQAGHSTTEARRLPPLCKQTSALKGIVLLAHAAQVMRTSQSRQLAMRTSSSSPGHTRTIAGHKQARYRRSTHLIGLGNPSTNISRVVVPRTQKASYIGAWHQTMTHRYGINAENPPCPVHWRTGSVNRVDARIETRLRSDNRFDAVAVKHRHARQA
jgi:hypothetical protein